MARKKKVSAPESASAEAIAATTVVEQAPKKRGGRPKGSKNKTKKSATKKSDAPMRYDAKTKAKILAAAKGKSIAEAHIAAVGAGYRGTAASLYQMLRNSGMTGKKKRGRPKGSMKASVATPTVRRGPGRPAKAAGSLHGGLGDIESIVSREVQGRINAAARAAIAELQKLIK